MDVPVNLRCRVCLEYNSATSLHPLSEKYIRKKFEECTNLMLLPADTLTQYLCTECYNQCLRSHKFRSQAIESDSALKTELSTGLERVKEEQMDEEEHQFEEHGDDTNRQWWGPNVNIVNQGALGEIIGNAAHIKTDGGEGEEEEEEEGASVNDQLERDDGLPTASISPADNPFALAPLMGPYPEQTYSAEPDKPITLKNLLAPFHIRYDEFLKTLFDFCLLYEKGQVNMERRFGIIACLGGDPNVFRGHEKKITANLTIKNKGVETYIKLRHLRPLPRLTRKDLDYLEHISKGNPVVPAEMPAGVRLRLIGHRYGYKEPYAVQ